MLLSERFPYAVHVAPLHAVPQILKHGSLLSRNRRTELGLDINRRTSSELDSALGLSDFVHLYLCERSMNWSKLTKREARTSLLGKMIAKAPFPHVALEFATKDLEQESDYLVNAWNLAKGARVGRPAPKGVEEKVEYWAQEMSEQVGDYGALRGERLESIGIPLMRRETVELPRMERPLGFEKAFDKSAELLIPHEVPTSACLRSRVYSKEDKAHFGETTLGIKGIVLGSIDGYDPLLVAEEVRQGIDAAFADPDAAPPALDFD